jgi:hypothetical protein
LTQTVTGSVTTINYTYVDIQTVFPVTTPMFLVGLSLIVGAAGVIIMLQDVI